MTKKSTGEVTNVIPAGLVRCEQCGELKGRGITPDRWHEVVIVSCLCDGIVCSSCGESRLHRPISNYYDEANGEVIHVPYFGFMAHCQACRRAEAVRASAVVERTPPLGDPRKLQEM